jgi:hypothetical protein
MAGGNGYIQLHRKVMEHPVFEHDGLYRLWSYCLMRANWKEAKTMVPGTLTPIEIRRGQFITGREKLYAALYGENYKGEKTPTLARNIARFGVRKTRNRVQAMHGCNCMQL